MKIRLFVLVLCCGMLFSACASKESGQESNAGEANNANDIVLCSINGCKNGVYKDGLCAEHYVSILGQGESATKEVDSNNITEGVASDFEENNADSLIEIPDVSGVEEDLAKQLIFKKSLIPVIESEYSYDVKKGTVIRTDPESGAQVAEDTKVSIFVSQGPSFYMSSRSTITWTNINAYRDDNWDFSSPYIDYGKLYIFCEYTPAVDIQFKSSGFGNASLTDSFDKEAPLTLQRPDHSSFGNERYVYAGSKVSFYIVIPLNQLEADFPTHVACGIVAYVGGKERTINTSFNMEWDSTSTVRKEDVYLPSEGSGYYYDDYYDDDYYYDDYYYDEAEYYIIPDSEWKELTESDLKGFTAKELTYARNEIYARHGYVFKADELNNYFNTMSWYYPDSSFSGELSSIEQKNANLIRDYQKAKGLEYSPK